MSTNEELERELEREMERELEREMERAMEGEVAPEALTSLPQGPGRAGERVRSSAIEKMPTGNGEGAPAPLSSLYGLSLPVAIELGRTSMKVQEVLSLGRGSVIELDRLAGEPVDVFVGDRRFAEGEVVVLGENFGVRITRIVPASGDEAA